ncbi:MAG: hypothetical protein HRF44_02720 [Ignavibacterium sp.]|jgi:hypothetical protein
MIAAIRHTVRENVAQPFVIFAIILVVAILGLSAIGISMKYENGVLVAVELFGNTVDQDLFLVAPALTSVFSNIVPAMLMFLFIIGASFVHVGMLQHPLTSLSLIGPLSRPGLFIAKYLGVWSLVTSVLAFFWVLLWLLLLIKSSGQLGGSLLLVPISASLEFAVLLSFAGLIAMIIQNSTAVAIISLGMYFYVGPLLGTATDSSPAFVKIIAAVFPPIAGMWAATRDCILGNPADFTPFLRAVPHTVVMLLSALIIFQRKDLS